MVWIENYQILYPLKAPAPLYFSTRLCASRGKQRWLSHKSVEEAVCLFSVQKMGSVALPAFHPTVAQKSIGQHEAVIFHGQMERIRVPPLRIHILRTCRRRGPSWKTRVPGLLLSCKFGLLKATSFRPRRGSIQACASPTMNTFFVSVQK